MTRKTLAVVLAVSLAAGAVAAEPPFPATPGDPVGPRLTQQTRILLLREMNAILMASRRIQAALVHGQSDAVAEQAGKIRDSFFLKKEMTPQMRADLRAAVGEAFIERDQAFHRLAGELAAAAEAGDRARQYELFGDLVTACAACHARHATDRFPDFAEGPAEVER